MERLLLTSVVARDAHPFKPPEKEAIEHIRSDRSWGLEKDQTKGVVLRNLGSTYSSSSFLLLRSTKSLSVATPSPRLPRGSQPVERCRGQNWYLYPWYWGGDSPQPLVQPA